MAIKEGCRFYIGRKLILLAAGLFFSLFYPLGLLAQVVSFGEIIADPAADQVESFTLINSSNQAIDLAGWQLADIAKKDRPIDLSGYHLPALTTLRFLAADLGLTLNNDNESLFLWQPNGELAATFDYQAPTKKSSSATKQSETREGVVTSLPHQLSSQYFYITYPDNSAGLKIYNYYKLWPDLKLGSLIAVTGQMVTTTAETKLTITGPQDIKVLEKQTSLAPLDANTNWANLKTGQFIKLTGQLSAKNQSTLYITDDQGEYLVQLKTGSQLKSADFTVGQNYELIGLALDNNGYRLVPRQKNDVILIEATDTTTLATTTLDFSQEKPATQPWTAWFIGSLAGLIIAFTAYKLAK